MTNPSGPIKTVNDGTQWSDITKYDQFIHEAADPVGWPIERVRGHIVIESSGDPHAMQPNTKNGYSYGLMQVVPYTPRGSNWDGWHDLVIEKAGLRKNASSDQVIEALYDPRINILVGVAILESFYQKYGTLDKASSAFFTGNPTWSGPGDSENKNTPAWYRKTLNALIAEQQAFDLVTFIVGGKPTNDSYGYKSPAAAECADCYEYFEGHGGHRNQHPGIDASGTLGQPLFSPINGTVVCGGTGNGAGAWGTGCAAFPDKMGRGAGRVEVLAEDGRHSLILGHCSRSLVQPGQKVTVGQKVAEMGGMNGYHVHIEAREWRGNDYVILDPRAVFSVGEVSTTPAEPTYPERLPVPQPEDFENGWDVDVITDGVKLLQSTAPEAPEVASPFKKGESFKAVYIVIGQDGSPFWITSMGTRVPLAGTQKRGEAIFPSLPCPPSAGGIGQDTLDTLVDTLEAVRKNVNQSEKSLRDVIAAIGALEGDS